MAQICARKLQATWRTRCVISESHARRCVMNLPGFGAAFSLGFTIGLYQTSAMFGGSDVAAISPMQGLSAGPVRSRVDLTESLPSLPTSSPSSQSLSSANCVDILYAPVCTSPNPLTECCTHKHEVKCPVPGSPNCTTSQVFSCTECHSTVVAFPTGGVLEV